MYIVQPPYLLKKLLPAAVWRMSALEKKIFLTFDDGPIPEITPWLLDLLAAENVKATFFCVGENVVKHPHIYQKILDNGHRVGNHTFNHLNGWNTDTKDYIGNVRKCANVLKSELFRPPYGRIKRSQARQLQDYKMIMWDVLSGDYDKSTSPQQCLENVIKNFRNGSVIVFHDNLKAQENLEFALPAFIAHAKAKGFIFSTF
ncbi:MAG: polysaccharide deacetylase family protein [Bacteroidota bacterium]|nr:polysaccharide deacetylase family protein [Bacteroidota bacterium]